MDIECPKCKNFLDAQFFSRDRSRSLGLDAICKECRRAYRKQNKVAELARWKRNYAPGSAQRQKHIIRSQTRRKFGSAKEQVCPCGKKADEWHHLKYETDSVIALCSDCHESL